MQTNAFGTGRGRAITTLGAPEDWPCQHPNAFEVAP